MERVRDIASFIIAVCLMVGAMAVLFGFIEVEQNVVAAVAFLALAFFYLLSIKANDIEQGDSDD